MGYRYMDWLLTVPLLLIEIIFCCNLTPDQVVSKAWALGVSSGLMIALGYPGEMLISENTHGVRFMFWAAAMVPFLYVVYTLLVGLKEAIASEGNPKVASMLTQVCYATVISWCTYPWSTSSRCSASMTPRPSSPSSWDTASPTSSPSAASASSSTTSPSPSRPRSTTRSSASRVLHPGGHNWRRSLLGRVSLRRCTGLLSFV